MRALATSLREPGLRRFVLLATVILGAAMLLAACSDGEGSNGGVDVTTTREPSTNTATATASATEGTGTATASATEGGADGDPIARGEQLVSSSGCTACHGAGISPAFDEVGTEVKLESGETVDVDEEYLHESIVDPDAKIVEGYSAGLMPKTFGDSLTDDDINAIVQYILSLNQ